MPAYHIETHFPRLTTLARALLKSDTVRNVFLYGRGTENRTLIDRLKADYSTFELYPHMVPPLRIELSLLGLRVRYATVTSRRDGFVNIFFYVPS